MEPTELYDYDQIKYISSADLCIRYNVRRILILFGMYVVGMYMCRRFKIQKRHQLVTNVISTLCAYYAILNGSSTTLSDYYIYDTIMSALAFDTLMTSHHIFTLYCLSFCPLDPDYFVINQSILIVKFGDIFVNHYKIADALNLYEKYPLGVRTYQLMSVMITMILWIPCRLVLPIWIYPFSCISMNVLGGILHLISFYWMSKFWNLAKKIGKEMTKHTKLELEEHSE